MSKEDKENLIAIFHKSSITKNILNEIDYIQENAEKVKIPALPRIHNTPMYFFISDSGDAAIPDWKEHPTEYISYS